MNRQVNESGPDIQAGENILPLSYGIMPQGLDETVTFSSEISALFSVSEMKLIYLNGSGRKRIDRELTLDLEHCTLATFFDTVTTDRFHSEILLKTEILGSWAGECELRDAWGSPFSAQVTLRTARTNEKGSAEYLYLEAQPTQRRVDSGRYVADRELLHAFMSHTRDAVYFKDKESRFLRISRALAHSFGLKDPREAIGKTDFDFFSIKHASEAFEAERGILESGVPMIDREEQETWDDGRVTWALSTKMVLRDNDNDIVGIFGVSHDITQQKLLAKQRHDLERQVELSSKLESIGRLAAGVAHEINTPMQYIKSNAVFLQASVDALQQIIQTQQKFCEVVEKSSFAQEKAISESLDTLKKMRSDLDLDYILSETPVALTQSLQGIEQVGRIVRSLKEFSHQSGSVKVPASLNEIVENAVNVCRHEWKYLADLSMEFDSLLPETPCIADQISQVILNLVINAAHAVEETLKTRDRAKGSIILRTGRAPGYAVIEVEDDADGIPDDVLPKIFDAFFTTKAVGKGTGQGLAIVKTIIETNHAGSIEVKTGRGQGTRFRILLPLI